MKSQKEKQKQLGIIAIPNQNPDVAIDIMIKNSTHTTTLLSIPPIANKQTVARDTQLQRELTNSNSSRIQQKKTRL